MKKVFADAFISAIDVGTTKICVLIGKQNSDGSIDIIGVGKVPSDGLRKGVVVDIAKTVKSIAAAVKEAELMAGVSIDEAVVGISGGHIQSRNAYGAAPIEKGAVTQHDIAQAIAAAKAVPLTEGQQILHVLPQFFSIDGNERLQDPLGMHGIRLEVQIHMITGSIASVQNLVTCCEQAGVKVSDIVLEQLASAQAVLSEDERELGVCMIDIGGGTSDVALYQRGSIRHTMVVPIAGSHFTNDLAMGLRLTLKDAERIKQEYGTTHADVMHDYQIPVELAQGCSGIVSAQEVADILEPRANELLSIIYEEILGRNMMALLVSGVVLTGGGALLEGMDDIAETIFEVPVRIGIPNINQSNPEILAHPMYATGYGLLLYSIHKQSDALVSHDSTMIGSQLLIRMKSWVSDFF